MKMLLKNSRTIVNVNDVDASGASIAKYLKRLGPKEILVEIFFSKRRTYSAYFNGIRIILDDTEGVNISELLEQIQGLEVMEGDWSRINKAKVEN